MPLSMSSRCERIVVVICLYLGKKENYNFYSLQSIIISQILFCPRYSKIV